MVFNVFLFTSLFFQGISQNISFYEWYWVFRFNFLIMNNLENKECRKSFWTKSLHGLKVTHWWMTLNLYNQGQIVLYRIVIRYIKFQNRVCFIFMKKNVTQFLERFVMRKLNIFRSAFLTSIFLFESNFVVDLWSTSR